MRLLRASTPHERWRGRQRALAVRAPRLDRLDVAPDHCEHRRPMLRRHAVHTAVWPVVHVASGHHP